MFERMEPFRISVGSFLVPAILAACGGGGGGGPMHPGDGDDGLSVSGTWLVTSELIEEDCPVEVDSVSTGTIQIEQEGTQITFRQGLLVATGTLNLQTGNFAIEGSLPADTLGTVTFTESGRFTSNEAYTSENVFVLTPVDEPGCSIRRRDTGARQ